MTGAHLPSFVRGIDLAPLGAHGAAMAWGSGGPGTVVGLVQVRGRRLSARLGISARPASLERMAKDLLTPGGGGMIVVHGADAPRAALDLVLCRRGDDAARLAGLPDAAAAREVHGPAAGAWLREAFGTPHGWEAANLVAEAGLPAVAAEPLMGSSEAAAQVRAFMGRHMLVGAAALSRTATVDALRSGRGAAEAFAGAFPGLGPAHLRRLSGIGLDRVEAAQRMPGVSGSIAVAGALLDMLGRLPPDWVPRGTAWADAAVVSLVLDSAYVLDSGCLASLRGDWEGLVGRLRRSAGIPPEVPLGEAAGLLRGAARDLGDASAALCSQLLLPLAAHAHAAAGVAAVLNGPGDLEASCLAQARDILYGGRGLAACFEVSARWHARQDAISRAFMAASPDMTWPVPFEAATVETSEGPVTVVPLGDALSLHEEGRAGRDRAGVPGLDHCVFGRLGAALRGDAHIVSLRRSRAEGGYERLSTAQLDLGLLGFTVGEHQGLRNAEPPTVCAEVLAVLSARYAEIPLDVLPRAAGRPDPVRDACGYDWRDPEALAKALSAWEPLLPRALRGLGVAGICAALPALTPSCGAGLLAA